MKKELQWAVCFLASLFIAVGGLLVFGALAIISGPSFLGFAAIAGEVGCFVAGMYGLRIAESL